MSRARATTRLRAFAAAAALGSLAIAGCGVPTESEAREIGDDQLPEALREETPTESSVDAEFESVTLWLVRNDSLVSVVHNIEPPVTAFSALQALGSAPSAAEQEDGLRTAIPDVTLIIDAGVIGGTAIVEIDESFDQIPATDQVMAIGQLVLTLTDLRGVGQVSFQLDAVPIAVPLPEGRTANQPVSADDYRSLIAP